VWFHITVELKLEENTFSWQAVHTDSIQNCFCVNCRVNYRHAWLREIQASVGAFAGISTGPHYQQVLFSKFTISESSQQQIILNDLNF